MRVLLLAGTSEATELAHLLAGTGVDVVASFAGHTQPPALPCGVRVGGFGGVEGLAAALAGGAGGAGAPGAAGAAGGGDGAGGFDALVDATHPFSRLMPAHAVTAAAAAGVPHLRLERPAWPTEPGWTEVGDIDEVPVVLGQLGARRVLLTLGRLDIARFAGVADIEFVVRSIGAPDESQLPAGAVAVLERGPFTVEHELEILDRYEIDTVVTRNSGGSQAKLAAARQRAVPVVVISRPSRSALVSVVTVATAAEAAAWVGDLARRENVTRLRT